MTECGGEGAITVMPPQWQVAMMVVLSYDGSWSSSEGAISASPGWAETAATVSLSQSLEDNDEAHSKNSDFLLRQQMMQASQVSNC